MGRPKLKNSERKPRNAHDVIPMEKTTGKNLRQFAKASGIPLQVVSAEVAEAGINSMLVSGHDTARRARRNGYIPPDPDA